MLNRKKTIFLLLILGNFFLSDISVFAAVWQAVSNEKQCEYRIEWRNTSWFTSNIPWTITSCTWNIDMWTRPDWIHKLYFRSLDNTVTWWANIMPDTLLWIYKLDTQTPKCKIEAVNLYWTENQYYNDWELFYRGGQLSSWKFDIELSCTDSVTPLATCFWEECVSWTKEVSFPWILWVSSNTVSFPPTGISRTFMSTYVWSWNYNQTIDLLSNIVAYDSAGNSISIWWSSSANVFMINNSWIKSLIATWINTLILTPDNISPIVNWNIGYELWNNWNWLYSNWISVNSYFAALNDRKIKIPWFTENWSWLRKYNVYIEGTWSTQPYISYLNNSPSADVIINHDFSDVSKNGDYSPNWYRIYWFNLETISNWITVNDKICDNVWNCTDILTPDFKVVANIPDYTNTLTNSSFNNNYSGKISNLSDKYNLSVAFKDKYNNEVVPVSWVKKISLINKFNNTLWVDQINDANSWNWVKFVFKDWNNNTIFFNNSNNNSFTKTLLQKSDLYNWELKLSVQSVVPTYNEYITAMDNPWEKFKSLYWNSLTAKLEYTDFKINVTDSTLKWWVWEYNTTWNSFLNILPNFKFNPLISFNYIWNIYPLVEWQLKSMLIKNVVLDNLLTSYNLYITTSVNNSFLEISKSYLQWWSTTLWNDNVNRYTITNSWIDWILSDNSGTNSNYYNILPQSIGWIKNNWTKIALYSYLEYKAAWRTVTLPWIQTWFNSYWVHTESDFKDDNNFINNSKVIFSEVKIKWINQSNNKAWKSSWTWAVTVDNNTFKDFSNITLLDLKTSVNKNVVNILKWLDKSIWNITTDIELNQLDLDNFNTNKWLSIKWWNIIYINWNNNYDVTLKCWNNNACKISGKKTIIIENANLIINSDMYYENSDSILWIILIWNTYNWWKSELRISENITNWVWIVYSEWPVVSVDWFNNLYNWTNIWENLINQLYWKWSFMTKNTIWWSINYSTTNKTCPYWTPEYEKITCTQEISQWYDLIYLRRYARINESYYLTTNNPMWDNKVPLHYDTKNVKIAWWITIDITENSDMVEPLSNNLIKDSNNYDSPFILEYDTSIQLNPPYGFE